MAKITSSIPIKFNGIKIHNDLEGLNEGDYLHLTQFEKAKLDGIQSGAEVNVNADWNAISGDAQLLNKPSTFPPSAHTHLISEVVNLENELNGKASTNALDYLQLNKEDKANKNIANGYAGLDSSGKINPIQLPSLAITDTFVVASQAEQLALVAEVGDVAVRTDLNKSFILRVTGASTLANWQELLTPVSVDQTIIDGSTNAVAGNAVFDGLALKSNKANFINIKDLGGIGDGVFDNTTIVNNALLTYKEVYFPDGNYLVTSLVNDLGSKITGSGVIVKSIAGGTQQLNTGIDRYNYIFGQEYLSFFQSKQLMPFSFFTTSLKVAWSGDSTTAGDGLSSEYFLNNLFLRELEIRGVSNVSSLNMGYSGANTEQWRTTYLATDLAQFPDLYILRWGINDPYFLKNGTLAPADAGDTYPNRRDIVDFETSLRAGLTTIRASRPQEQMSIILMSPNPTSDTPNARDEKWYEQVRKVYIKAARDFKCAFIDTYSIWLDSRGAAGIYMDNPYGDGRAIHPKEAFNCNIVSKIADLCLPSTLLAKISDNHTYNKSSIDGMPLFSANPSTYNKGLSINRVQSLDGWGVDGSSFTIYNRDNTGGQFNFSRLTAIPEISFRAINFGISESIPLNFSNSVKLWHDGNLPFSYLGSTISTAQNLTAKSVKTTGRIFAIGDSDYGDLLSTNGALDIAFSNGAQRGGITSYNWTTGQYKPLDINSSALSFYALSGVGNRIVIADTNGNLGTTNLDQRPYKVYTALLSQSGTNAPIATVLENTLGGTVVWSRNGVGDYSGTLNGAFVSGKTIAFQGGSLAVPNSMVRVSSFANSIQVITNSGGSIADGILTSTSIEIRVYL